MKPWRPVRMGIFLSVVTFWPLTEVQAIKPGGSPCVSTSFDACGRRVCHRISGGIGPTAPPAAYWLEILDERKCQTTEDKIEALVNLLGRIHHAKQQSSCPYNLYLYKWGLDCGGSGPRARGRESRWNIPEEDLSSGGHFSIANINNEFYLVHLPALNKGDLFWLKPDAIISMEELQIVNRRVHYLQIQKQISGLQETLREDQAWPRPD